MKNEYLITFDSADSTCTDVDSFKNLLKSNTNISFISSVQNSTIKFKNSEFQYQLARGRLTDESFYYDLTIEDRSEEFHDDYCQLLRSIRKICANASGRQIIVLHDGIGEFYCQKGYPVIYKTENLMRKLISKFMAISVGYDWRDASTPKEVLESIRGKNKKEQTNILLEVDFSQLSTFLFNEYTKASLDKFIQSLSKKEDEETIKVSDLKQFMPSTNWEKYFSAKVQCDSGYLKTRWEKLYVYRCKIAHCKGLTDVEYEDLVSISNDLCEKIELALNSVGDIHIEKEDREELAENLSSAANKKVADLIANYNNLSVLMRNLCEWSSGKDDIYHKHRTNQTNIRMQSQYLCNNKKLISKDEVELIYQCQALRNQVVHKSGMIEISESEILSAILDLEKLISRISSINIKDVEKRKDIDYRNEDIDEI